MYRMSGYSVAMRQPEALLGGSIAPAMLAELCRQFHVRRLDIFGSAATGHGFDPDRSDLDLLVRFEPLAPADYAAAYFGFQEALERLAGRSIDLLTEAALENPYLRRRIDAERRVLFAVP